MRREARCPDASASLRTVCFVVVLLGGAQLAAAQTSSNERAKCLRETHPSYTVTNPIEVDMTDCKVTDTLTIQGTFSGRLRIDLTRVAIGKRFVLSLKKAAGAPDDSKIQITMRDLGYAAGEDKPTANYDFSATEFAPDSTIVFTRIKATQIHLPHLTAGVSVDSTDCEVAYEANAMLIESVTAGFRIARLAPTASVNLIRLNLLLHAGAGAKCRARLQGFAIDNVDAEDLAAQGNTPRVQMTDVQIRVADSQGNCQDGNAHPDVSVVYFGDGGDRATRTITLPKLFDTTRGRFSGDALGDTNVFEFEGILKNDWNPNRMQFQWDAASKRVGVLFRSRGLQDGAWVLDPARPPAATPDNKLPTPHAVLQENGYGRRLFSVTGTVERVTISVDGGSRNESLLVSTGRMVNSSITVQANTRVGVTALLSTYYIYVERLERSHIAIKAQSSIFLQSRAACHARLTVVLLSGNGNAMDEISTIRVSEQVKLIAIHTGQCQDGNSHSEAGFLYATGDYAGRDMRAAITIAQSTFYASALGRLYFIRFSTIAAGGLYSLSDLAGSVITLNTPYTAALHWCFSMENSSALIDGDLASVWKLPSDPPLHTYRYLDTTNAKFVTIAVRNAVMTAPSLFIASGGVSDCAFTVHKSTIRVHSRQKSFVTYVGQLSRNTTVNVTEGTFAVTTYAACHQGAWVLWLGKDHDALSSIHVADSVLNATAVARCQDGNSNSEVNAVTFGGMPDFRRLVVTRCTIALVGGGDAIVYKAGGDVVGDMHPATLSTNNVFVNTTYRSAFLYAHSFVNGTLTFTRMPWRGPELFDAIYGHIIVWTVYDVVNMTINFRDATIYGLCMTVGRRMLQSTFNMTGSTQLATTSATTYVIYVKDDVVNTTLNFLRSTVNATTFSQCHRGVHLVHAGTAGRPFGPSTFVVIRNSTILAYAPGNCQDTNGHAHASLLALGDVSDAGGLIVETSNITIEGAGRVAMFEPNVLRGELPAVTLNSNNVTVWSRSGYFASYVYAASVIGFRMVLQPPAGAAGLANTTTSVAAGRGHFAWRVNTDQLYVTALVRTVRSIEQSHIEATRMLLHCALAVSQTDMVDSRVILRDSSVAIAARHRMVGVAIVAKDTMNSLIAVFGSKIHLDFSAPCHVGAHLLYSGEWQGTSQFVFHGSTLHINATGSCQDVNSRSDAGLFYGAYMRVGYGGFDLKSSTVDVQMTAGDPVLFDSRGMVKGGYLSTKRNMLDMTVRLRTASGTARLFSCESGQVADADITLDFAADRLTVVDTAGLNRGAAIRVESLQNASITLGGLRTVSPLLHVLVRAVDSHIRVLRCVANHLWQTAQAAPLYVAIMEGASLLVEDSVIHSAAASSYNQACGTRMSAVSAITVGRGTAESSDVSVRVTRCSISLNYSDRKCSDVAMTTAAVWSGGTKPTNRASYVISASTITINRFQQSTMPSAVVYLEAPCKVACNITAAALTLVNVSSVLQAAQFFAQVIKMVRVTQRHSPLEVADVNADPGSTMIKQPSWPSAKPFATLVFASNQVHTAGAVYTATPASAYKRLLASPAGKVNVVSRCNHVDAAQVRAVDYAPQAETRKDLNCDECDIEIDCYAPNTVSVSGKAPDACVCECRPLPPRMAQSIYSDRCYLTVIDPTPTRELTITATIVTGGPPTEPPATTTAAPTTTTTGAPTTTTAAPTTPPPGETAAPTTTVAATMAPTQEPQRTATQAPPTRSVTLPRRPLSGTPTRALPPEPVTATLLPPPKETPHPAAAGPARVSQTFEAAGVPKGAATAVTTTSTTAAAVGGAVNPGAANKASNMANMLGAVECAFSEDDIETTPMQVVFVWSLGDGEFAPLLGPILSICGICTFFHLLNLFLYHSAKESKALRLAVGLLSSIALGYFLPTAVGFATLVLGHGSDTMSRVVGAVGIVWSLLLWLVPMVFIAKAVGPVKVNALGKQALPGQSSIVFSYRYYYDVANDPNRMSHLLLYFEDLGVALVMSVVGSIKPSGGNCTFIALVLLLVAVGHLMYLLLLRPIRTKLDTFFAISIAVLQAVIGAGVVAATMYPSAIVMVAYLSLVLGGAFFVQTLVMLAWTVYLFQRRSARRKKAEKDDGQLKSQGLLDTAADNALFVPELDESDADALAKDKATADSGAVAVNPLGVATIDVGQRRRAKALRERVRREQRTGVADPFASDGDEDDDGDVATPAAKPKVDDPFATDSDDDDDGGARNATGAAPGPPKLTALMKKKLMGTLRRSRTDE